MVRWAAQHLQTPAKLTLETLREVSMWMSACDEAVNHYRGEREKTREERREEHQKVADLRHRCCRSLVEERPDWFDCNDYTDDRINDIVKHQHADRLLREWLGRCRIDVQLALKAKESPNELTSST